MSSVKRTFIGLLACLMLMGFGAGFANANSGTYTDGNGSCQFDFDSGTWVSSGLGEWTADIDNAQIGSCSLSDFQISGNLEVGRTGTDGSFTGDVSYDVVSSIATCSYTGTLVGTWQLNSGPPSEVELDLSGTVVRSSGSTLFCVATQAADLDLLVDADATSDNFAVLTTAHGTCEFSFDRTPWTNSGPGTWSSEMSNSASTNCAFTDITVEGTFEKASGGTASFDLWAEYSILSGLVTCTYVGAPTGTWQGGSGLVSQKEFSLSGTLTRVSGSALFCPATTASTLDAMVNY